MNLVDEAIRDADAYFRREAERTIFSGSHVYFRARPAKRPEVVRNSVDYGRYTFSRAELMASTR